MADVLVVDDHPDSCHTLVRLIQLVNGPAVCVESGPEALRYLQTACPKLVFLDWMMPEMTGLEVLRRLRADARFSGLPVVMYSALSDAALKRMALDAGAQDFLVKGQIDELLLAVQKYVKDPA